MPKTRYETILLKNKNGLKSIVEFLFLAVSNKNQPLDKFRHKDYIKYAKINVEVVYMEELYKKSLQMIKELDIKSEKEYNKMLKNYRVLSSESLKYISNTRRFKKIIRLAKEA